MHHNVSVNHIKMYMDCVFCGVSFFCGVPQGSIPVPLVFHHVHVFLLGIFYLNKTDYNFYTGDTYLYVLYQPTNTDMFSVISCLADIQWWMLVISCS